MVKDAGHISYLGLPGQIKTGCMASLAFKSRFCQQHTEQSCSTTATEQHEGKHKSSWMAVACACVCERLINSML